MLQDLPGGFYKSKSIKILLLNGCSQFTKLPERLGKMVSLTTLEANYKTMRKVSSSIVRLKKLKSLSLWGLHVYVYGSPSTYQRRARVIFNKKN